MGLLLRSARQASGTARPPPEPASVCPRCLGGQGHFSRVAITGLGAESRGECVAGTRAPACVAEIVISAAGSLTDLGPQSPSSSLVTLVWTHELVLMQWTSKAKGAEACQGEQTANHRHCCGERNHYFISVLTLSGWMYWFPTTDGILANTQPDPCVLYNSQAVKGPPGNGYYISLTQALSAEEIRKRDLFCRGGWTGLIFPALILPQY